MKHRFSPNRTSLGVRTIPFVHTWPNYAPRVVKTIRRPKTPGRTDPCPCGSGRKAKNCCLKKIKFIHGLPPSLREAVMTEAMIRKGPVADQIKPQNTAALDKGKEWGAEGDIKIERKDRPQDGPAFVQCPSSTIGMPQPAPDSTAARTWEQNK